MSLLSGENGAKKSSVFIQSVDRALAIVESFTVDHREWGVTDLAKSLGLNKSTVFGLLATLELRGYVEKSPENGKYRMGLKLLDLGTIKHESLELVVVARPVLKDLIDRIQETVHLAIYDNGEVVYVDKIEAKSTLNIISYVGKRNPTYCTGVGKCLLAFQAPKEIERVIGRGLRAYTQNTITDPDKLLAELEKIRTKGCAFDSEEIELGLVCVAAPIMNHLGRVIAALSVSVPTIRAGDDKLQEYLQILRSAAIQISQKLGYKGA